MATPAKPIAPLPVASTARRAGLRSRKAIEEELAELEAKNAPSSSSGRASQSTEPATTTAKKSRKLPLKRKQEVLEERVITNLLID